MVRFGYHEYPPGLTQDLHAHAFTTLTVILAGSVRERVGRREEIGRPFSIVIKPADTEHADTFGERGARTFQLRLTLESDEYAAGMMVGPWRWLHADRRATRSFLRLAQNAAVDDAITDLSVYDVLAAVSHTSSYNHKSPPRWLRMAREQLDDAADPPRLSQLAAIAGVHPIHLAREFRRFFRCSISEYVHQRRIQAAAALLAAEDGSCSRVAYRAGFSDHPHMCRVFKRVTGITPTGFLGLLPPK